jgi:hypothetical protein
MKKIFFLIFFFFSTNSYAYNFKESIESYKKKNTGTVSDIYVFNRCSAVFAWWGGMLSNEPKTQIEANMYKKISENMLIRATVIHKNYFKNSYDTSKEENNKRFRTLVTYYFEDGKENFLKKGEHFTGNIRDDVIFCSLLEKEF